MDIIQRCLELIGGKMRFLITSSYVLRTYLYIGLKMESYFPNLGLLLMSIKGFLFLSFI